MSIITGIAVIGLLLASLLLNISHVVPSPIDNPQLDLEGSGHGRRQAPADVIAIKEGQDLDLSCPIVVQNEDLIISWTCNNEPANIRTSRIHVTESGKLRIRSAKVGDSCNYRCEAADGFETFSVIIRVVIVDRHLMDQLTKRADKFDNSTSRLPVGSNQQQIAPSGPKENKVMLMSQPDINLGIEMQIDPSEVHLDRNKTFTLTCRIKHVPNLNAPQIIWLKEYLGDHVDSMNEAFEKNLILIDGVYYHSLNWPRALSYSKETSTANSVMLVKQTNWLHSGRYICFAGYPASIMHLHLSNSLPNAPNTPTDQVHMRPPIRYRMAQATVTINDKEGEAAYRASRASGMEDQGTSKIWAYARSNITSLIVVLIVVYTSIAIVRFIALKKGGNRKNPSKNMGTAINDNQNRSQTQGQVNTEPLVAACGSDSDYIPGFRQERFDLSHVPTNSLINDNNPLGDRYKFDQALLHERLNCIDLANSLSINDHIYSEIGYRIAANSGEEPYYKQPTRMNKQ